MLKKIILKVVILAAVFYFTVILCIHASAASIVPTPSFMSDCSPNTYYGYVRLNFSCQNNDAVIYFTTDGTTPSGKSIKYDPYRPCIITRSCTIRASAKLGNEWSGVLEGKFNIIKSNSTIIPSPTPTPPTPDPTPSPTPALNSVTPPTITYDARKLPALSVNISTQYSLTDVKNGTTSLISGKDYTVSGSTLSIAPGFLNYYFTKFPTQDLKLILKFNTGNDVTFTVNPFWEPLATITPNELKINKVNIADVPVTMTLNGNTLISVNNGTSVLTSNDYTVSGNVVTIKKSYITYYTTKFPTQNLNIIFKFSNGYDQVLSLYTGDSPNTVISPTTVTYKVGSNADVSVSATMNGNFFSSINNGTSTLLPRIDYTYAPNTNTLCIKSNYMAYFFNKFNQNLVLTVNLTGGKPVTLTIKPALGSIKGMAVTARAGQKVSYVVKTSSIKDLGKFLVDINYDPSKLKAEYVQKGNIKNSDYIGKYGEVDLSGADKGTITVISCDESPVLTSNGDLFTIVFDVIPGATGTANIQLEPELYDSSVTLIPVQVDVGSITITN
ncbi:MAG TPA: X2-like carbohydrate binding domain-containing protein [Clostridia bacterium]